ncbi:MAG: MFS transporter [Bacteroidales bacterium]
MKIKGSNIFDSLRFRNFKLYFYGQCISLIGTWMQQVAMGWLVYRLTGSLILLGTLVFLSQIPTIFITPFASALIDKISKKKVLIFTQSFSMLQALILTILVFTNTIDASNIWIILLLSIFLGIVNAFDGPTRQSFYTSLVPQEYLTNAVALNSAIINGSRLIGPAIGGLLIGIFGEGGCFLINTVSYTFVIVALFKIRLDTIEINKAKLNMISDMKEGFHYMNERTPIKILLIITLIFSFLIFPITSFFPAYTKDTLQGGSETLGLIMSFLGIGSLSGALFLASRKSIVGLDKIQFFGVMVASLIIIPYFFVTSLWISLILSPLLGFCLVGTIASTNTMLQALTESKMKGRIMGYYTICFIGGSALGSLFLGWLSHYFSLSIIMASSGIICLIGLIIYSPYLKQISIQQKRIYTERGIIPEIAEGISQAEVER